MRSANAARCSAVRGIFISILSLNAVRIVDAYWQEECGGNNPEFLLPENPELDCSFRQLALEYATKQLQSNRRLDTIVPRLHAALNLSACSSVQPVVHPYQTRGDDQSTANAATSPPSPPSPAAAAAAVAASFQSTIQIYVAISGSDSAGTGSKAAPFATLAKAQQAARAARVEQKVGGSAAAAAAAAVIVWMRNGTYYTPAATGGLTLTTADSGASESAPTIYAGYPGEDVTISGATAALPSTLEWKAVPHAQRAAFGLGVHPSRINGKTAPVVYRAQLPKGTVAPQSSFIGLFGNGVRLPRARYPNCDDVNGHNCYLLNTSGPTSNPTAPTTPIASVKGAINLEVINEHGVDMFADTHDNSPGAGPHGASDGTLPAGANKTLKVQHPDYAWRCHEDCGWNAYSKWRGSICEPAAGTRPGTPESGCRMDPTFNQPYWDQQVSGGFYYNATGKSEYAPSWTTQQWATPSTGTVHMYHTARWGGWQFALASRNDTAHTLQFFCTIVDAVDNNGNVIPPADVSSAASANVRYVPQKGPPVPCPTSKEGGDSLNAVVHGGWQEARGAQIGEQYTLKGMNNSYFVENIKEELDAPGEWFVDEEEGAIYLIPPAAVAHPSELHLVPCVEGRHTVVKIASSKGAADPVMHLRLENVTIAHAAATFMEPYEISSGGDWSIHRGGAIFVDGATNISLVGLHVDHVDGNGVFFSRHVRHSRLSNSDFTQVGDTAIAVVGASGMHRTNQAASLDYPAFNLIEGNHVGGVGVWGKQSAAYFKSVTRENTIKNNVFHDSPRSLVNYNDGAMGGEVMEGNILFNSVTESNDHGPFNSWDRQPYVYRVNEDEVDGTGLLAISPQTQTIAKNMVFNVYFHGQSCGSINIDFDDETSQMNVTDNVLVYGGVKAFDGMDRQFWNNLIVYPKAAKSAGPACFHALSSTRNVSSGHTHFFENTCVLFPGDYPYNCGAGPAPFYNTSYHVDVHSNRFVFPNASAEQASNVWADACSCWPNPQVHGKPCPFHNFSTWQSYGHDVGSTSGTDLSNSAMLAQARKLLGLA